MRPRNVIPALSVLLVVGCSGDGTGAPRQAVAVTATDTTCEIDVDAVEAGEIELTVRNTGTMVTEVYVYGKDDAIIGEVENVTPGLTRSFVARVGGGDYEVACKPGQVGDGIRATLTVSGTALEALVPTREVVLSAEDYTFSGVADAGIVVGQVVQFEMQNDGTVAHEFEVFSPDDVVLGEIGPTAAGDAGRVVLAFTQPGTHRFVCDIEDHAARGMRGTFDVVG